MNNLDALLILRNCAIASPSLQTKQGKTALSVVDRKIQSLLRKKAWRDGWGTPVHMGDPDFKYPLPDESAELRKDKERLDWLDSQCRGVEFFTMDGPTDGSPPRQFFQVDGVGIEKARLELREAIDAAHLELMDAPAASGMHEAEAIGIEEGI